MTPSVARQSVILKCNMKKSVLLGNYEFYYLGGLMNRLFGLHANADMSPQELKDYLDAEIPGLVTRDDREAYLISLALSYEPLEGQDEQMRALFAWGETEQALWQVQAAK